MSSAKDCPEPTDILVCGGCRQVFTDICDLAQHKKSCPGHGGTASRGGGSATKGGAKGDQKVSTGAGSGGGAASGRGSCMNSAAEPSSPPKNGSQRQSSAGAQGGASRGASAKASTTGSNSPKRSATPDSSKICEDIDPCNGLKGDATGGECDAEGMEGDEDKVPEILAVGAIIPRDQQWYSPIGLEPGNRILICGRFRRDNVVPIVDLWHNIDEQRVFFYSVCFDDCRAVIGSKLDGKWVAKQAVPGDFPYELSTDFTLEILCKEDSFTVNWRGVKGDGTVDFPYTYEVEKVNMLRMQEFDMIYKIEKDWF